MKKPPRWVGDCKALPELDPEKDKVEVHLYVTGDVVCFVDTDGRTKQPVPTNHGWKKRPVW